ncbi:MAG: hypothetical protein H0W08_27740 [Acidobacteria bacterium]|nr:hypothetical protein [Acidobacteriota bacterium]
MNRVILVIALLLGTELSAREPGQFGLGLVRIIVPPVVLFQVPNVGANSTASSPTTVSFDQAVLGLGEALRISVRADGDLTLPGGGAIPATNISWTTSNVLNGIGINGALNKITYTPVFESTVGAAAGRVVLTWTLSAPGGGLTAGTRYAALRWRFEAVTP